MRKTTAYARKMRRTGGTYNGAEFLNTIQRSRGYTEPAEPALGLHDIQDAATKALVLVKFAMEALTTGATPPENEEHFDRMAHALGVSCIRAGQIAGEDVDKNPMLPPLVDGNNALRQVLNRRRKWGKWQVLPAEADTLKYAVEIYETILLASTPAQMVEAVDLRMRALKGQTLEALT
jgi:hypothetical protein